MTTKNYTDPRYWAGKDLIPTEHAVLRAQQREIELPVRVDPSRMALVDCVIEDNHRYVVTFKISQDRPYFLVLSSDGKIVTVFHSAGKHFAAMTSRHHRKIRK